MLVDVTLDLKVKFFAPERFVGIVDKTPEPKISDVFAARVVKVDGNAAPSSVKVYAVSVKVNEVNAKVATSRVSVASALKVKVTAVTKRQSGVTDVPFISVHVKADQLASPEIVAFTSLTEASMPSGTR